MWNIVTIQGVEYLGRTVDGGVCMVHGEDLGIQGLGV